MARRILWVLLGLLGLALGLALVSAGALLAWLRSDPGSAWLLQQVVERAQPRQGSLEIASMQTDLRSSLRLHGVVLKDASGHELAGCDSIELAYGLGALLRGAFVVHHARVQGLRGDLGLVDGDLDIVTIWSDPAALADAPDPPTPPWQGLPVTLVLETIEIQSDTLAIRVGERRLTLHQASLHGGLAFRGDDILVDGLALSAGPACLLLDLDVRDLGGHQPWLDLRLESLVVDADLLPLELPVTGIFELSGELLGPLDAPASTLELVTPGGPLSVDARLDLGPERPLWSLELETVDLALDEVVLGLQPLLVSGRIQVEGEGLSWPEGVDALARIGLDAAVAEPFGAAHLEGRLALTEGLILVPELFASTPTGTVSVRGLVDVPAKTAAADILGLVVQLSDLGRYGAAGLRGEASFAGQGEVDWSGAQVAALVEGRLRGRHLGSGADLSIGRLEGPISGSWIAGVPGVAGDLRVGGIRAGPIRADRGRAVLSWQDDRVSATVDVFDQDRAVVGLDASGDLGTRRFQLSRLLLSPAPDQVWTGEGIQRVTLVGGGFTDLRLAVTSGASGLRATGRAQRQGPLALEATLVDLSLDTLAPFVPQLAGLTGAADAKVELGGSARQPVVGAQATVTGLSLPGSVRGLDARIELQGTGDRVGINLTVGQGEPPLATLVGTLPVRVSATRPGWSSTQPVDLLLVLPRGSSARWNELLDGVDLPELDGELRARVSGSPLHPDLELEADLQLPAPRRGAPAPGFTAKATSTDDALRLDLSMVQDGRQRARLEGDARLHLHRVAASLLGEGPAVDLALPSTWLSELDLVLRPDLPLQSLDAFVAVPDAVQGTLVGELGFTGPADAPRIAADLRLVDARLGELPLDVATIQVEPAPGGTGVRAELGFGEAGDLRVEAFLPIELRAGEPLRPQLDRPGMRLAVGGAGIPLQVVAALWPGMQDARGRVVIEGELGGAMTAPTGLLRASADGVGFRLSDTGVMYDELRFDLHVDERALSLRDLHVRTREPGMSSKGENAGTVEGEVEALLQGASLGEWKGRLDFDRALLSALPDRYLRVGSGRLVFSGTPPEMTVNGSLRVENAQLSLDERFFQGPGAREHPSWLTVHRGAQADSVEIEAPAAADEVGLPEWLTVNLALHLNRATFLRARLPLGGTLGGLLGPLATLQLDSQADGTVNAALRDGALSLTGQVEVSRGDVVLFGKPFEIEGNSTITFTGRDAGNPVLNVLASYDTRSYGLVTARISGVANAPVVDLSSVDYPSQDDVVSLLLFDQPASEMTDGEGGDGASAAAMSMLLTSIGQTLGRQGEQTASMVIAPDLLVVGNGTARVGKRLGRRIFVVVDIDNTADDVTRSYLTLTVEYAIGGPWEAEFRHGTAGQDAVELNWTRRR